MQVAYLTILTFTLEKRQVCEYLFQQCTCFWCSEEIAVCKGDANSFDPHLKAAHMQMQKHAAKLKMTTDTVLVQCTSSLTPTADLLELQQYATSDENLLWK